MKRSDWWHSVVVLVGALAFGTCILADDRSAAQPALAQVRRASLDVFTLEVEVERPISVLRHGQGNTTRVVRITVDKDITAIVWKASKLPAPRYYPPDTNGYESIDYDGEGNLILWMATEAATIRDHDTHDEYSERAQSFVAPDGTVVRQASGAMLNRYQPSYSNTQGMSTLRTIRWALGRPPADDLGESEVEEAEPDGTREIRAAGQYSPYSGQGVWSLVVDSANGHLVRQAAFGGRGQQPSDRWLSEGTRWFGDVALAEQGEYISEPPLSYHMAVRLISFSPEFDPTVLAEARQIIARSQTRRVQVYDYRDDPHRPKVRLVPAGDLDKDE